MAETREARTLSGADVGREVTVSEPNYLTYTGRLLTVEHGHDLASIRLSRSNDEIAVILDPTDLVTLRDVE